MEDEDCSSGDKVRILQNRSWRDGGRIKELVCGFWIPEEYPDREAISTLDSVHAIDRYYMGIDKAAGIEWKRILLKGLQP